MLLGLGLFTALMGSCGVIFLSHQLDDRFYRRDEVEEILGIPVLVSLQRNGNGHSRIPIA
jgi:capsular polysaccharide biosynthesis protein